MTVQTGSAASGCSPVSIQWRCIPALYRLSSLLQLGSSSSPTVDTEKIVVHRVDGTLLLGVHLYVRANSIQVIDIYLIMTTPVLVKAYSGTKGNTSTVSSARPAAIQPLPPVSSYAFADILRSADCPEFQHAINGIAEICAKSRLSLADEYASHLPPLGEITAANSATMRPHLMRSGMRRPLTSVPEASSGSSEGSGKAKKRKTAVGSLWRQGLDEQGTRRMQIGRMGRVISVGGTVALVKYEDLSSQEPNDTSLSPAKGHEPTAALSRQRTRSDAVTRLRGLLGE